MKRGCIQGVILTEGRSLSMNPIAAEVLVQATVMILEIGMAIGCVVGIILIFKPEWIQRWNRRLNKWYSTRRAFRFLEKVHDTDPWFFKNNKIYGGFMLVISLILLYFMVFVSKPPSNFNPLVTPLNHDQYIVLQFTYYILLGAVIISIPLWIMLIFMPQILEKVMPVTNHWISTRTMLRKIDVVNSRYDDFVLKYPKLFGLLFILLGLGGLVILLV